MHSHMVTSYRFFGGAIALHGLVHFLNPSLTEVVYAYFDRISYVYHPVSIMLSPIQIAQSISK